MNHWHAFYFRMVTPPGEEPKWWVDIFLLDTLVRDVVSAERSALVLWRVHRRFGQDSAGHEFLLQCYTTDQAAQEIDDLLRQHTSRLLLQDNGILEDYHHEKRGAEIESISQPEWPVHLQKSWPYFIHGASQMLLNLTEQVRVEANPGGILTRLTEAESLYIRLNNELAHIWQQWGSHAFFHHINELFGYVPVIARPSILATF